MFLIVFLLKFIDRILPIPITKILLIKKRKNKKAFYRFYWLIVFAGDNYGCMILPSRKF